MFKTVLFQVGLVSTRYSTLETLEATMKMKWKKQFDEITLRFDHLMSPSWKTRLHEKSVMSVNYANEAAW